MYSSELLHLELNTKNLLYAFDLISFNIHNFIANIY